MNARPQVSQPLLSVVLNTYNRAHLVLRAVDSVLRSSADNVELIVVDDGSTDDTPSVLAAVDDARMRVLRHENMGLCGSRNVGASAATGVWLMFLDDDDTLADEAIERIVAAVSEPMAGTAVLAFGAVVQVRDGDVVGHAGPAPLYDLFDGRPVSVTPGAFCVRRDHFDRVGGYLDGLPFYHQTELMMRLMARRDDSVPQTIVIGAPLVNYTIRDANDREMTDPMLLRWAAAWVLTRHDVRLAACPVARHHFSAAAGVAAAKLGDADAARRHLWASLRCQPMRAESWARAAMVVMRPVRRRAWRAWTGRPLPSVRLEPSNDHFLPDGYAENPPASHDSIGPYWGARTISNPRNQVPVYRVARQVFDVTGGPVVDIGCGSGDKLVAYFGDGAAKVIGVDQPSGIGRARELSTSINWMEADLSRREGWESLHRSSPHLVLCVDVIEHVDDANELLANLKHLAGPTGTLIVSTPDRARMEGRGPLGPPANVRHVREWTRDELDLLFESHGLTVVKRWRRLPRSYSLTILELKRFVWRLLHLKALPDRRSSLIYQLRVDGGRG